MKAVASAVVEVVAAAVVAVVVAAAVADSAVVAVVADSAVVAAVAVVVAVAAAVAAAVAVAVAVAEAIVAIAVIAGRIPRNNGSERKRLPLPGSPLSHLLGSARHPEFSLKRRGLIAETPSHVGS